MKIEVFLSQRNLVVLVQAIVQGGSADWKRGSKGIANKG